MKRFQTNKTFAPAFSAARSRQRGTSLLEGIAYLAIAALVILGAIALLVSAFSGANSNRTQSELSSIRTGVKKLYMGSASTYGSASLMPQLISSKVLPGTLTVDSSGGVINAWGGPVLVNGAGATFTISYGAVPQDICVQVVSGGGDWSAVSVNGAGVSVPSTPTQASAACTGSSNTVVWTAS
ncbi:MAG TPA: type 4 pilus major pilin [Albitalea sp.]|uniref:type 4 pilus major pilin n=1 Tax=Piscinibacter sp. TaxID=1903157 RepID=UPI002ED0A9C0